MFEPLLCQLGNSMPPIFWRSTVRLRLGPEPGLPYGSYGNPKCLCQLLMRYGVT